MSYTFLMTGSVERIPHDEVFGVLARAGFSCCSLGKSTSAGCEGTKARMMRRTAWVAVISVVLWLLLSSSVQAVFFDDFDSYADGDLQTVSGGIWVKESGSYVYPLQIGTIDGSKKAYMTAEYDNSQPRFDHYAPASNVGMPNGGADYTVSVDLAFDASEHGLGNDATMGVIARRQSAPFDYVYAQIYFQDVDVVSGMTTLYLFTSGGSYFWASGVSLSTLENNSGSISMTLDGAAVHVQATWNSVGTKTADFTVSGHLLNPGPAGIISRDRQGTNYYYVSGAFDNFSVDHETTVYESSVRLWPRGDSCYLCAETSMPMWPEFPTESLSLSKPLVLTAEMPAGFQIETFGVSTSFALHPKPLIVPTSIESSTINDRVVYEVHLPIPPTSGSVRPALLVHPGNHPPGEYEARLGLRTEEGYDIWQDSTAVLDVLGKLAGRLPQRLQIAVCDYAGYENALFKQAIADAVLDSGINSIWNMHYYDMLDTVAQQVRPEGVKAGWLWFWRDYRTTITDEYPQARELNAAGVPEPDSLCYTWCIQNPNEVVPFLADVIQGMNTPDKYDIIINDNEETAISSDHSTVYGDLYTPITLDTFRAQAGIAPHIELTPEIIAADYPDQWVAFRCWQSAQMALLLSEAIELADPDMLYGYYSGYEYTGQYEGFSRETYSTDWTLLPGAGLHFGSAGYYGGVNDIASTANALGDIPFIPGEMFFLNFLDQTGTMPDPDGFAFKLMRSAIYGGGRGGVMVWYLQVLDAAGFSAIRTVSSVLAEIEDVLIDGVRCDDAIMISPELDLDSVFAYETDARRIVMVFNSTGQSKQGSLNSQAAITEPDTFELPCGAWLGGASNLPVDLDPYTFTVFVTQKRADVNLDGLTNGHDYDACQANQGMLNPLFTDGDVDHDSDVDGDDLALIYEQRPASCLETGGTVLAGDISGDSGEPDCVVDWFDLGAFCRQWGQCVEPSDPNCSTPWIP